MTPSEQTDLPIDSVRPHPSNPRKGNVAKIVESIKANGFYGSIVVQKSTMTILAGNHRWQAAKECGMKTIPAMLLDIDDLSAKKILLAVAEVVFEVIILILQRIERFVFNLPTRTTAAD